MKTREKLFIEILMMIVITAIVIFTCVNLTELVTMFNDAAKNALSTIRFGL